MDNAKMSFLHVSQNVPMDSPMEVHHCTSKHPSVTVYPPHCVYPHPSVPTVITPCLYPTFRQVTMSKPVGSQVHVSQAVPRSR